MLIFFKKYGPIPASFSFSFCPFLIPITISIIEFEEVLIVCLGFKPGAADGRRRRNHAASMATAH